MSDDCTTEKTRNSSARIALPRRPRVSRRNETAEITHPIVVALNKLPGVWASQNRVGSAITRNGWPITYGLGVGSADIVGCRLLPSVRRWTSRRSIGEDARGVIVEERGPAIPLAAFFALEVKWPGKKPNPTQRAWMRRLSELGATVAVVHSVAEAVGVVDGMIF